MRYRTSGWALLGGLTIVAVSAGSACAYAWVLRLHKGVTPGQHFLLLAFGPMLAGMVCQGVWKGMRMVWRGMMVYEVTPDGLELYTPLGRRRIWRNEVRDFSLLPGAFPRRPDRLILHLADGSSVRVPLKVCNADRFRLELSMAFEQLGAADMDRVRYAGKVPSLMETRWRRNAPNFLGFYAAIFISLLFTLGALAMGWDHVNYWRIRAGHETAIGKIVKMQWDGDTASAIVRYTPRSSGEIQLHRSVLANFRNAKGIGDSVTVEYLPEHPEVGRIQGWDMDGRNWIFALLAAFFACIGVVALKRFTVAWVMPLRMTSSWKATPDGKRCRVEVSPNRLAWEREAFAEWHAGAVVFNRIVERRNGATIERNRANVMTKAGLSVRRLAGGSVAMGLEEAARLWERLGMAENISADYRVLRTGNVAEAERVGLRLAAGIGADQEPEDICFTSRRGRLEPIESGLANNAFDRWVNVQVRELYEFVAPAGIRGAAFAQMLGVRAEDGEYRLFIERMKSGPRVWIRRGNEAKADRAEWRDGTWHVVTDLGIPSPLRHSKRLPKWLALFALPLVLVVVLVILPFYPLLAWERRRKGRDALRQLAGAGKAA